MNLLEVIFSLFIISLLSLLQLKNLHSEIAFLNLFKESYTQTYSKIRLRNVLDNLSSDNDTQPFYIPSNANIRKIQLENISNLILRPHAKSKAISSLKIDFINSLYPKENQSPYLIEVCNPFQNKRIVIYKTYLAVNFDGVFEVQTSNYSKINSNCFLLDLKPLTGLYNDQILTRPTICLLAIKDNYTIYQDSNLMLRKVTNRGKQIVANQPLLKLNFPATFSNSAIGTFTKFEVKQELSSNNINEPFYASTISLVPRQQLWNFLAGSLL